MRLFDELRTLAPLPRPAGLRAPPVVGERAPGEEGLRFPAVVSFLRHPGCPFAEATVRGFQAAVALAPQVTRVLVGHGSSATLAAWLEAIGGLQGARLVDDEDGAMHARWGVAPTGLGHLLRPAVMTALRARRREGLVNRPPAGSRWQRAATFAVSRAGVVAHVHLAQHAGDVADVAAALRAAMD